jgi:hypothetical protein
MTSFQSEFHDLKYRRHLVSAVCVFLPIVGSSHLEVSSAKMCERSVLCSATHTSPSETLLYPLPMS